MQTEEIAWRGRCCPDAGGLAGGLRQVQQASGGSAPLASLRGLTRAGRESNLGFFVARHLEPALPAVRNTTITC